MVKRGGKKRESVEQFSGKPVLGKRTYSNREYKNGYLHNWPYPHTPGKVFVYSLGFEHSRAKGPGVGKCNMIVSQH